jgi:hypothetical protein
MNDVNLSGICKLFERPIQRGLKRPGLRFIFNGALVSIKKAPDNRASGVAHQNAGCFYIVRENQYIGKITPDGVFKKSGDIGLDIINFLKVFSDDPVKIASEYGRKTGVCCFCGNSLNDARSLAKGYGPQCAKSWDMAWGDEVEDTLKKSEQTDLGIDTPILSLVASAKRSSEQSD